jgi:serine/threonine-protein kinase HipA
VSRRGRVFVADVLAGFIEETAAGEYVFRYDPSYLSRPRAEPVSLTMSLRAEPYVAEELFPFFDGLIPEGWLLGLVTRNWKLDPGDRMALLLAACRDCIGAVHVVGESDGGG